eukprot:CAMPEP_0115036678 /NCGR_PEP_ID=MMETSP0216-20121206/42270_1 /TAXON_ID=223996 /ORGANISM="Protocruzia adherens, Strain Boccale" /LENGTH=56 /DNA_ID=CAMNT_0002416561 /DNA_START=366 /DNA_END=536 /DNA_ORIENTATION=+
MVNIEGIFSSTLIGNELDWTACKELGEGLKSGIPLALLYLQSNNIGDDGAVALEED